MTAVNGAVVWSTNYSSFGEASIDLSSTIENHLRFPGQYYDIETGLHYNWNRYFSPKIGRYLREDPAGIMRGLNHLFIYSRNGPLKYIDVMGLVECEFIEHLDIYVEDSDEKVIYGDWIYDSYQQLNIFCWCFFYRDKRIDVTVEWKYYEFDVYFCWEDANCEVEQNAYIEFRPTFFFCGKDKYSKYGGRERKRKFGTMYGVGAGIESGSGCDCRPKTRRPPGIYQG